MRYTLLAFILLWSSHLTAQLNGKYIFRNINVKDGLLHSTVYDIGQDDKGFIWVVTPNGLQRFDGYRFVNYPEVVNYPLDIVENASALVIDTVNNHVGVIVNRIMEKVDLTDNNISVVNVSDVFNEDTGNPFVYNTKDNEKWVMGEKYINVYIGDSLSGSTFIGDKHRGIFAIHDSTSGEVFIQNPHDFGVKRKGSQDIEFASDDHPTHPLLVQLKSHRLNLQYAIMDSYRSLWIVPWDEFLLRYDLNDQTLYQYDLQKIKDSKISERSGDPVIHVGQILEDRQRNIWIAMDNAGLVAYDRQRDDFQFITSDARVSNGLEYSFAIYAIYQDDDDNIWVGTDRGISIFNPYRNQIQIIRHQHGNPNSLPKNDILDVIETSEGEILVGTWGGGITAFDNYWNFQRHITFDGGEHPNQVWCFMQHDDGSIWAGTQGGYIHIYDPVQQTFKTIRPPETGYNTIMYMRKDHEGNLLLGLSGGRIAVWKKNENKFRPYNQAADTNYLAAYHFNDLLVDEQGQCWASFNFGLKSYDQHSQLFTGNYPIPFEGRTGRNANGIESFNDSLLLVGTKHGGLQLFNKHTFTYQPFLEDELPKYTSVFAIKKDDENNIWFTTEYWLYKIDQKQSVTRVHLGDNIVKNAMGWSNFYQLNDRRWVTSSFSELLCFDPKELSADPSDLDVRITSFFLFDEDIYVDSFLAQDKPVILKYDKNFFSIGFANMNYHDLKTINFYYRLSDVDPHWVSTETPMVDYTDIKPGEYVFEVKAEQGNAFSKVAALHILITPPWWGTWWFRALSLIVAIALISFGIRKRIQIIRKQSELRHRIAETEMMALRAQMNPHFIFNCINSIDAMIQGNDKYRATTYLNKFAKLIRNILDSSAHNKIPLSKDLQTLRLYVDLELFQA